MNMGIIQFRMESLRPSGKELNEIQAVYLNYRFLEEKLKI